MNLLKNSLLEHNTSGCNIPQLDLDLIKYVCEDKL